jgi:signal transduction histidine kinase
VKPHPDRRAIRLVDRKIQFGLAWRQAGVLLCLYLAGLVVTFAPSLIAVMTETDLRVTAEASNELLVLHRRLWPAMCLVLIGSFIYTVHHSHRICGPIYRVKVVLRDMINGRYPQHVGFRKGDQFPEVAELLGELGRTLHERQESAEQEDAKDEHAEAVEAQ